MLARTTLFIGATGQIGGLIANSLLDRGQGLRILVRPGSEIKAKALVECGATIVEGDLEHPQTLEAAVEGITRIVATAASIDNNLNAGYDTLLHYAKNAGVKEIFFLSNIPGNKNHSLPLFQAKGHIEEAIMQSGLTYTILKAEVFGNYLVNSMIVGALATGYPVSIFGKGDAKHALIDEQNVVDFANAMIGNPQARNKTYVVGGPTPVSFRELIDAYREENAVVVNTYEWGDDTPPGMPIEFYNILSDLNNYESTQSTEELAREYGVSLTPLANIVHRSPPVM